MAKMWELERGFTRRLDAAVIVFVQAMFGPHCAPVASRFQLMRFFLLYLVTAAAEIFGCYSVYLWFRAGRTIWWLLPGALALAAFAWLLSLHPSASGRVYAAYGGIYIAASIAWLWMVDGVRPDRWDLLGSGVCLFGAGLIYFAPRS